jgi:hypothetical protein
MRLGLGEVAERPPHQRNLDRLHQQRLLQPKHNSRPNLRPSVMKSIARKHEERIVDITLEFVTKPLGFLNVDITAAVDVGFSQQLVLELLAGQLSTWGEKIISFFEFLAGQLPTWGEIKERIKRISHFIRYGSVP